MEPKADEIKAKEDTLAQKQHEDKKETERIAAGSHTVVTESEQSKAHAASVLAAAEPTGVGHVLPVYDKDGNKITDQSAAQHELDPKIEKVTEAKGDISQGVAQKLPGDVAPVVPPVISKGGKSQGPAMRMPSQPPPPNI